MKQHVAALPSTSVALLAGGALMLGCSFPDVTFGGSGGGGSSSTGGTGAAAVGAGGTGGNPQGGNGGEVQTTVTTTGSMMGGAGGGPLGGEGGGPVGGEGGMGGQNTGGAGGNGGNGGSGTGGGGPLNCVDADGDLYLSMDSDPECLTPQYLGLGDCDDNEKFANPGQTTFFTVANGHFPPGSIGAWDWNCDGAVQLQYTTTCTAAGQLNVTAGIGGCGDSGLYKTGLACLGNSGTRTQGCK